MRFLKKLFSTPKEEVLEKAKLLLEESSPSCPIVAVVEQDNRAAYFYLWGPEGSSFGVKSCWIRNLKPAPLEVEYDIMERGFPPMLPAICCKYTQGQEPLQESDLEVIWFEEGDGAALLEKGNIIAVIPSWGGQGGFHGYARDCIGQGEFAWELPDTATIAERVSASKIFWNSWQQPNNPWELLKPQLLQKYTETFGAYDQLYNIDNNQWPPKSLYFKKGPELKIFLTLGVSLRAQPSVEMYTEEPHTMNRIELGFISSSAIKDTDIIELNEWIRDQTHLPWGQITWLGEGHTIHCEVFERTKFEAILLTTKLDVFPKMDLHTTNESPINLLWMIPITEKEKDFIIDNGSQQLIEKLQSLGTQVFSLERKELKL